MPEEAGAEAAEAVEDGRDELDELDVDPDEAARVTGGVIAPCDHR